ncbi:MAG: YggU family protein [Clostridia bacterium]|nr:YggU family protein [Deltaproteobacteria bacterium]
MTNPAWLNANDDATILLDITVVPKSSRTRILAVHDARLKIQLTAQPVDGQANEALVRFIAETLGVSKAQVDIVGGAANRKKTVRLTGVNRTFVILRLTP